MDINTVVVSGPSLNHEEATETEQLTVHKMIPIDLAVAVLFGLFLNARSSA